MFRKKINPLFGRRTRTCPYTITIQNRYEKTYFMMNLPLGVYFFVQTIFRNPSEVRSYVLPSPEHCNVPASTMLVSNDCLVVIDSNVPTAHVALHHWQPNTPDGLGAPFLFHHGKNAINSSGGAIFRIFKGSSGSAEDYQFPRAVAFAASAVQSSSAVVVTCDKEVITGNCFIALQLFPSMVLVEKLTFAILFGRHFTLFFFWFPTEPS